MKKLSALEATVASFDLTMRETGHDYPRVTPPLVRVQRSGIIRTWSREVEAFLQADADRPPVETIRVEVSRGGWITSEFDLGTGPAAIRALNLIKSTFLATLEQLT